MNEKEKIQEELRKLRDDRMYRTVMNLKTRAETIQDEDGQEVQEMIVEGQAVTFESETTFCETLSNVELNT